MKLFLKFKRNSRENLGGILVIIHGEILEGVPGRN